MVDLPPKEELELMNVIALKDLCKDNGLLQKVRPSHFSPGARSAKRYGVCASHCEATRSGVCASHTIQRTRLGSG